MIHLSYEDDTLFLQHSTDRLPAGEAFSAHAHEYPELLYIISGEVRMYAEGTPYQLLPGDLMLFRAAETHRVQLYTEQCYERVVLQLKQLPFSSPDLQKELLSPLLDRKLGEQNRLCRTDFAGEEPGFYFRQMLADCDDRRLQLLCQLPPLLLAIRKAFLSHLDQHENETTLLCSRILQYINDNLTLPLRPEEVADRFFISRTALYSLVRESTGYGVKQYVTLKRLLMAKERLRRGEKPQAVFADCGFGDYSSFFRAYKRQFGCAPRADHAPKHP